MPVLEEIVMYLAATKQFLKRLFLSVCPPVRHTVLTMFPSSYHPEVFRSYCHWQAWQAWCQCKRSRSYVKVTEVMTLSSRFRNVTPVWIHIWWWNDAQILMLLRRSALLFFKVIRQISTAKKIVDLDPNWVFPDWWRKPETAQERCPIIF